MIAREKNPMTRAVLMLGGRSRRMRATRGPQHKMLAELLGVPIVERNIGYLLAAGFRELVAVTSAEEPEVQRFLESRGRALAAARRSRLEIVVETEPLGTIGALRQLARPGDVLFVMAADNLTALDPRRMVAHHRRTRAAMTVATHTYDLRCPFGEVQVAGGRIRGYREKPVRRVRISSALYVVDAEAAARIPVESRFDAPELVRLLLGKKRVVAAYVHDAPWIDVNDRDTLAEAERLVLRHPEAFELWRPGPDRETTWVVGRRAGRIAIRRVRGAWDLPELPGNLTDPAQVERAIERLYGAVRGVAPLAVFDGLDVRARRSTRHHVYQAEIDRLPRGCGSYRWLALSSVPARAAPVLRRAIAYVQAREFDLDLPPPSA
jgi:CTP:molybdopterin cytidylyltransferase MocA